MKKKSIITILMAVVFVIRAYGESNLLELRASTSDLILRKYREGLRDEAISTKVLDLGKRRQITEIIIDASLREKTGDSAILLRTADLMDQEAFKELINECFDQFVQNDEINSAVRLIKCVPEGVQLNIDEKKILAILYSQKFPPLLLADDGRHVLAVLQRLKNLKISKESPPDLITYLEGIIKISEGRYHPELKIPELAEEIKINIERSTAGSND